MCSRSASTGPSKRTMSSTRAPRSSATSRADSPDRMCAWISRGLGRGVCTSDSRSRRVLRSSPRRTSSTSRANLSPDSVARMSLSSSVPMTLSCSMRTLPASRAGSWLRFPGGLTASEPACAPHRVIAHHDDREYPARAASFTRTHGQDGAGSHLRKGEWSCKLSPPARASATANTRKLRSSRMATDYDAPRKTEDDSESIEALKERVPDKLSGSVDVEDADNPSRFELPRADLSDLELDVVVFPAQEDEFTCSNCFLVKHRSQLDHETADGPICTECAA